MALAISPPLLPRPTQAKLIFSLADIFLALAKLARSRDGLRDTATALDKKARRFTLLKLIIVVFLISAVPIYLKSTDNQYML